MSQGPWSHHSRSASVADDIDFEVKGQEAGGEEDADHRSVVV